MSNVELMPCLCGGKAYLHEDYSSGTDKYYYEVYTFDEMFSAFEDLNMEATKSAWDGKIFGTDWCDSESEAIELWNRMVE